MRDQTQLPGDIHPAQDGLRSGWEEDVVTAIQHELLDAVGFCPGLRAYGPPTHRALQVSHEGSLACQRWASP